VVVDARSWRLGTALQWEKTFATEHGPIGDYLALRPHLFQVDAQHEKVSLDPHPELNPWAASRCTGAVVYDDDEGHNLARGLSGVSRTRPQHLQQQWQRKLQQAAVLQEEEDSWHNGGIDPWSQAAPQTAKCAHTPDSDPWHKYGSDPLLQAADRASKQTHTLEGGGALSAGGVQNLAELDSQVQQLASEQDMVKSSLSCMEAQQCQLESLAELVSQFQHLASEQDMVKSSLSRMEARQCQLESQLQRAHEVSAGILSQLVSCLSSVSAVEAGLKEQQAVQNQMQEQQHLTQQILQQVWSVKCKGSSSRWMEQMERQMQGLQQQPQQRQQQHCMQQMLQQAFAAQAWQLAAQRSGQMSNAQASVPVMDATSPEQTNSGLAGERDGCATQ